MIQPGVVLVLSLNLGIVLLIGIIQLRSNYPFCRRPGFQNRFVWLKHSRRRRGKFCASWIALRE